MSQTKAQLIDPVDGSIVNADINASAAIAGTKISPDFGSQNIATTGSITGNDLEIDSGTLSIDASNNRVGIGTTSPAELLHLQSTAGNTKLRLTQSGSSTDAVNGAIHFGNSTDGQLCEIRGYTSGSNNSGFLEFRTTSSGSDVTAMTITTSGNVGIGTSSASAKFDVTDGTTSISFNKTNNTPRIDFKGNNVSDLCQIKAAESSGGGIFQFLTKTTGGTATERMRIDTSGNVGIGTTSPDQTLHVHKGSAGSVSSSTASVLTLENSSEVVLQFLTPASSAAQLRFGDPSDNGSGFIRYDHSVDAIQFGTNGPEKMRLDSSGRLLTGGATSSHGSTNADDLQIGANNQSNQTGITLGSASASSIRFADASDDTAGAISYQHSDDSMRFFAGSSERVRIDTDGLKFNGDSAATNALHDYEEGTFSFNESNISVSNFEAKYTKIGRQVMLSGRIAFGSSSSSQVLNMTGLPFTPDSGAGNSTCGGVIPEQNLGIGALFMAVEHGNNSVRIRKSSGLTISPEDASNKGIRFVLHYVAAS